MKGKFMNMYKELVKLPFDEVQTHVPYFTYGDYQRIRLLHGIDKIIIAGEPINYK